MKLEQNARIWVQLGKKKEAGVLLEWCDSPNGDYQQCKVELLAANPFSPGQLLRNVYPRPVQSYKLTQRYSALSGED